MTLSLYETTTARTGEYKVHNTQRTSNNEKVVVTKTYLQDDSEIFNKYDLKLLEGLSWKEIISI
jgi:hypothetical protein